MKKFIVPALLLAFWLRIDAVGDWSLRWDESFSVWFAQMGLAEGTIKTAEDIHPPLYFWLLHVWVRLAGISEFAIRALSVFLGLMTVAAVWSLTLRLSRRGLAAALAVLLITLSPFHIPWSQDARMYPLSDAVLGPVDPCLLQGMDATAAIQWHRGVAKPSLWRIRHRHPLAAPGHSLA